MSIILAVLLAASLAYCLILTRKNRQLELEVNTLAEDNMKVRSDIKSAIYKIKMYEDLISMYNAS